MKNKGPNLAKWKDYRLQLLEQAKIAEEMEQSEEEMEQLTEQFIGIHTMKPINRDAPNHREMAKKSVAQIESDMNEITELLKIVKQGLNEGKVPDSTTGNGIMQLAARIGAVAGQMWK